MAPPIGFPAQPRHDLMARLITDLRSRSDQAREETVTGLHADPARALGGRVAGLFEIDHALGVNGQFRDILDLAQSRAVTIQASLGTLTALADDLQAQGQTALDTNLPGPAASVRAAAVQALAAAVSAINVSQGGRGLFSGDAGAGTALAGPQDIAAAVTAILEAAAPGDTGYGDLTAAFSDPGGIYAATLYQGGAGDAPASEVADGVRIAFAPRADAPGIAAILRDIAALAAAFDPANAIADDQRTALAAEAIAGLRSGTGALAALSGTVGVAEARMAEFAARHEADAAALAQARQALAGRDQFEAAAELTAMEAQLETTYLTTARLASLSLANFLR